MSSTSKGNRVNRNRSPRLHPATRAIRHALAFGLVIAAAQPAFAGTCDLVTPTTAICNGVFVDATIAYAIDDLTLVVGSDLATTIDPLAGARAIDLYASSGAISLTTSADVGATNASAIVARAFYGNIDIHNTSDGAITATGSYSNATGIDAASYYGDIAVVDDGVVDVAVTGYGNATGIRANNFYGNVAVSISDTGAVSASTNNVYGGTAMAVRANSVLGGVSVTNDGDLQAHADAVYGNSTAYGVNARGGYYHTTAVTNTGDITSTASTGDGVGWAWGARARGDDTLVDNQGGTISTDADAVSGYASATSVYARGNTSHVSNSGQIFAHADVVNDGAARAYGAMAWGETASSDNSGFIGAYAHTGYGDAVAMGILTYYSYHATEHNSGDIFASANASIGVSLAMGIRNEAHYDGSIDNVAGARIDAVADTGEGYSFAYGAWVNSYHATATNAGDITASATTHAAALGGAILPNARAIGVNLQSGDGYDTSFVNDASGNVSASASVLEYGHAYSFGAISYGTDSGRLENHGTIASDTYAVGGMAVSVGEVATGSFAVTLNYGAISSEAVVYNDGMAQSVAAYTTGEVATLVNEGSLSAIADVGLGQSTANGAQLYGAWVASYNYGDITSDARVLTGVSAAYGIASLGIYGSTVLNAHAIVADAHAIVGDAIAGGVDNYAYVYGAYITNNADITASATTYYGNAMATGTDNTSWLYGAANTTNAGHITATATVTGSGTAQATGVNSYAFVYGPGVVNSGTIAATATVADGNAKAIGVSTDFYHGDAVVQNDGRITVDASTQGGQFGNAYAYAVVVDHELGKYNFPNVAIVNNGDILANATNGGEYGFAAALGVQTRTTSSDLANSGTISVNATTTGIYGTAQATGTALFGKYFAADVNDGTIVATATAHLGGSAEAAGASDIGFYNDTTTINHGDIGAFATSVFDGSYGGNARATAVYTKANYTAIVDNSGAIVAQASADHGSASATGLSEQAKYGTATLYNGGDIVAFAQADAGTAKAAGTKVNSKYGGATHNDGLIEATAIADGGGHAEAVGTITLTPGAHGYFPYAIAATLYNGGDIHAAAHADGGQAVAMGARVEGASDSGVYLYNAGAITALAEANGGYAFATGSKTWSYYGDVRLANFGDILAQADGGTDGHGVATGARISAEGSGPPAYHAGHATVANTGTIAATAHGTVDASAIGASVNGELGAQATNDGMIAAHADAGDGLAQSAAFVAYSMLGGVTIDNTGTIAATANGGVDSHAYAVHMDSTGTNALVNTGNIFATGNAAHTAVWSGDNAIATIDNHGLVAGGLRTGSLDDTFSNAAGATWLADGTSDFGAGDDAITNAGLLGMTDATISLGDTAGAGNRFANSGTILVGGSNRIDMGAANGFAFDNAGIIDFRDGATDDALTIGGDFQGSGTLRMDVSGARGTADTLAIEGNVAAGSVGTIDLTVLDMPTSASSTITLVRVDGDSTDAAFRLGTVRYDQGNFLSLDFATHLDAKLDASNATADLFSLGVSVTGLNDTGTLAASVAPGAQRLMASQIGTWRQRMVDPTRMGGMGLWVRAFQDEGTIDPKLASSNFGQGGRFGFDQKSFGTEFGIDYAATEQLRVGALLAKADAHQSLDVGIGSGKIDGDTWGAYATWVSPQGFYVDASYRRMKFGAHLDSAARSLRGDGHAKAYNLEAGWAWTLSNGLVLEPQAQYMRTQVDDIDAMEGGVSAFRSQGGDASTGRIGLLARKTFGTGTTWTPYASINAVREFDGENAYSVNGLFFGATTTEGTSTLAESGIEVRFAHNVSVTGGLHWQDGGALQGFFGGQVGVRFTW